MLKREDFNYSLPPELIAQAPIKPRDQARLLLINRAKKIIKHDRFSNLVDLLSKDDLLVINDSKVFPARISAKKISGGKVEIFLPQAKTINCWQCLLKGRVGPGLELILNKKLKAKVINKKFKDSWLLQFNLGGQKLKQELKKIGQVPLPPYIKKGLADNSDRRRYQTVYANKEQEKSVAAPTAGLHFTKRIIEKLAAKKIEIAKVTLQVGWGTFAPVKAGNIKGQRMHEEEIVIKKKELIKILQAKQAGRKIVAVGTTVCRTLETIGKNLNSINQNKDLKTTTDIFIYPGYQFLMTDALLTNFHLPQSSLLMLVSALAGKKLIDQAYQQAIKERYRFFSYGDAMLIY